ncbi:hypothetical protein K2173_023165 [Erythroxylum novogranatense]|uniref:Peptidase S8/S53 domain-containing protein n=1 Tax=Erythroxylum novogranatense TaxID=1862640 RepID=A0AAV8UAL5_9ROSI|nr:hypothetical protein K2173_023165 [Erythroxylum novogranatense]
MWPTTSYDAGAIIGVVDSGIWLESESFNDDALYKALHGEFSSIVDIFATIDAVIADGVDILLMSVGLVRHQPVDYFNDLIAIGSLKAIEKGIFVVAAAGNNDLLTSPFNRAQNVAPWITTVEAATIDRIFETVLKLKNGNTVKEISYFPLSIFISNTSLYFGRSSEAESI